MSHMGGGAGGGEEEREGNVTANKTVCEQLVSKLEIHETKSSSGNS